MSEVGTIATGAQQGQHLAFCRVCGWKAAQQRDRYDLAVAESRSHICPAAAEGRALVGIDPAFTNVGIVRMFPANIDALTVKSPTLKRGDMNPHTWSSRIERLAASVVPNVPEGAFVALEGASFASRHGNPDERAGLRWSIIARLRVRGCRIVVIPPLSAKMWLTDNGNAGKPDMIAAARDLAPGGLHITNEHEADAFALVSMLAAHAGRPIFEPRPRGSEALGKVSWEHLKGTQQ